MYGADMKVRGIRLRSPGGKKFAVLGSQEGVFRTLNQLTLKSEDPATKTVYVAEGPTDTAALLQLGFTAVGRPSCTGAVNILVSILKELRVVIVTDADSPGRSGASILAGKLKGLVESIKIIEPHRKDMREWVTSGATSEAVEMLVRDAKEYGHAT
jgi:5S rRNA maturation endonuclease (ribonuclease M5)